MIYTLTFVKIQQNPSQKTHRDLHHNHHPLLSFQIYDLEHIIIDSRISYLYIYLIYVVFSGLRNIQVFMLVRPSNVEYGLL